MHNAFGKLVTLGLLGSGFFATGDLGWLARRGRQLLDASTVPAEAETAAEAWAEPAASGAFPGGTSTSGKSPAGTSSGGTSPAGVAPADQRLEPVAPVTPVPWHASRPPSGGPAFVDLGSLEPGSRLFLWVAAGPTHGSTPRCIVLDIVDPAGGEALLHRGVEPPRRVVILPAADGGVFAAREPPGRIRVRGTLHVLPSGLAHAGSRQVAAEAIGPIVALALGQ